MRVTVSVPATVANLGPGFDCLALALDLRNEFSVDLEAEPGVEVEGEGAEELPRDGTNLVFRTLSAVAHALGGKLRPFRLTCRSRIPLQRGLGSSASAVVAGVLLADRVLQAGLEPNRVLELAVDLEGHPDNVAAALRGGLVVAYLSRAGWRAERLEPSPQLRPVVLVPLAERVSTVEARGALPSTVPLADAAYTLSRTALAVLALTSRPDLLAEALDDRLHQPYRLPLVPAARALFHELREEGVPVCVAGSGPALVAFEAEGRSLRPLGPAWRVLRPAVDRVGAVVQAA